MNLVEEGGAWRYVRVGRWRRGALRLRGGAETAARYKHDHSPTTF